jgi:hypothetical protein
MGLEYEYSRSTRTVTIIRDNLSVNVAENGNSGTEDFGLSQPPDEPTNDYFDLLITTSTHSALPALVPTIRWPRITPLVRLYYQ